MRMRDLEFDTYMGENYSLAALVNSGGERRYLSFALRRRTQPAQLPSSFDLHGALNNQ